MICLWQYVHLASGVLVNHSSLSLLIITPAGNTHNSVVDASFLTSNVMCKSAYVCHIVYYYYTNPSFYFDTFVYISYFLDLFSKSYFSHILRWLCSAGNISWWIKVLQCLKSLDAKTFLHLNSSFSLYNTKCTMSKTLWWSYFDFDDIILQMFLLCAARKLQEGFTFPE